MSLSTKKKIFLSWLGVILCIVSIFLVVPVARTIRNFVETTWNVSLFGYSVLIFVSIAFLAGLYVLWFRLNIRSLSNYLWLAAVALVYVYFTLKLWGRPEEAIHFLEYGLLGFLLYQALRHHFHDNGIYLIAILIGALVGILDEALQWMIPRRVWDFRDLGLNALSVGLFQIAVWQGIRLKPRSSRMQSKSVKAISLLSITYLLLFGLCFSNTPDRVQSYTKLFPFLSFLQKEEPMSEFKCKHRDPEIGVFFSRMTLEKIAETDSNRAEEYGRIFEEWASRKYNEFLTYFPGYARPFLHEMRVHVFRRDRMFSLAKQADTPKARKDYLFIAYKENLILEKYFGNTLRVSPYKWREKRITAIRKEIDPSSFYKSPVSAGFPIQLRETTMWGIILVLIAFLIFLNIRLSAQKKGSPQNGKSKG